MTTRRLKGNLIIEDIRLQAERDAGGTFRRHPATQRMLKTLPPPEDERLARELAAGALRISKSMAPELLALVQETRLLLGVKREVELYQSAAIGQGVHATLYATEGGPLFLKVGGTFVNDIDKLSQIAIIGHELGHHVAHGLKRSERDLVGVAYAVLDRGMDRRLFEQAKCYLMAQELTADRLGLLACQDLDAMLRMFMVMVSGLPSSSLKWDCDGYLADCKELMEETLEKGKSVLGFSHPEHNLRAYAAWLFSESAVYRSLTGKGSGKRSVVEIDATLSKLLRPLSTGESAGPGAGPTPEGPRIRRVVYKGGDTGADVGETVDNAVEGVKGALGKAGKAVQPGISKIKSATVKGVARMMGRTVATDEESTQEAEDFVDPLAEDEDELLGRFAQLEKQQATTAAASQGFDDDDDELLSKFEKLEKRTAPKAKAVDDDLAADGDERDLLKRLEELEKRLK